MFFLRDESGAIHVEGGEGLLFMSPADAKAKLDELKGAQGAKVPVARFCTTLRMGERTRCASALVFCFITIGESCVRRQLFVEA